MESCMADPEGTEKRGIHRIFSAMCRFRHPFVLTVFSLVLLLGLGSRSVAAWTPAVTPVAESEAPSSDRDAAFSVMIDGSGMNRPAPSQRHGLTQASLFDGAPKFHPLPFLPALALTDIPVAHADAGAPAPVRATDDPLRGAVVARGP
jgi:hypothetical protein